MHVDLLSVLYAVKTERGINFVLKNYFVFLQIIIDRSSSRFVVSGLLSGIGVLMG